MKNSNLKIQTLIVLVFVLIIGCQTNEKPKEISKTSSEDLKTQIKTQVDSLYKVYQRFDYDWI